jgi:hypothetical protein
VHARSTPALAMPALALTAALALAGCSGQDEFCTAYDDAGGTLATPGIFQVAMPPEDTIDLMTSRIEILEAVSPPDEIAEDWQTLHDLYTEVVTISEQIPDAGVVPEPRIFEIIDELDAPSTSVTNYLDATC